MGQASSAVGNRDEGLPFFTRAEADEFRALVTAEWAKHGMTMVVGEGKGHLVLSDGKGPGEAGLWNVGADCLREGRARWPEIIARHVALGAIKDPVAEFMKLSPSAVQRSVYLRLANVEAIPVGWCSYARDVAPGLVEVLNIHRRRATALVSDPYVEQLGGLDKLRAWGEANLRTLPVRSSGFEVAIGPQGGMFRVMYDDSTFTASRILTPERLVQQLFVKDDMGDGVVVALPNRNEVAVHLIEDDSLIRSMADLADFARLEYRNAPGRLSYHVYWVTPDRFEQVIGADRNGMPVPTWSPAFSEVVEKAMKLRAPWKPEAAGTTPSGTPRRARRANGDRGRAAM